MTSREMTECTDTIVLSLLVTLQSALSSLHIESLCACHTAHRVMNVVFQVVIVAAVQQQEEASARVLQLPS